MQKIILSIDSTCDLNDELVKKYSTKVYPYTITIGENSYKDNIDITPNDIYKIYETEKILPKTSTINVAEYYKYFKPLVDDGYNVIHINLGSSLTSAHNNCLMAASQLDGVYPIDSHNLSSGSGLLVLKAAELIEDGIPAKEISTILNEHRKNIHMSFVLDNLDFLYAGGRCSKVASFGSNLLKIKPVINVENTSGAMGVGNKYKGSIEKVIKKYIQTKLASYDNINDEHIFIVHSGMESRYIELAKDTISSIMTFKNIHITTASCTISSHCAPNTLGIAFETK